MLDLSKVYKELKKEESSLEELDKKSREVVKLCSAAIKHIHNKNLEEAEKLISDAYELIKNVDWKHYTLAMQEFTEAFLFLNIEKNNSLMPYPIKGVNAKSYLYGLLDLVGELKRALLSSLIEKDVERAKFYFEIMQEIYDECSQIIINNRVIPEFRRKLDIARIQLNNAHSIMAEKL